MIFCFVVTLSLISVYCLSLFFQVQKCHVWHFTHWGSWRFSSEGQIYGSWDGKSPASFPGIHLPLDSLEQSSSPVSIKPWWQTLKCHFQPIRQLKKQRKLFLMKRTAVDTFVLMNLYEQTYCINKGVHRDRAVLQMLLHQYKLNIISLSATI